MIYGPWLGDDGFFGFFSSSDRDLCLLSVLSSFVSSVCLVFVCGPPKADDLRGREQKVSTY